MLAIVTLCETLNPEQMVLFKQVLAEMDGFYDDRENLRIQVAELNARLDGATHSVNTYVEENQELREENESLRKQLYELSSSITEFQKAEALISQQREILSNVKRNVGEINQILSGFPSDWDGVPKEELGFREAPKLKITLNVHDDELPWWVDNEAAGDFIAHDDAEFAVLMASCLETGGTYNFDSRALQEMAEKVTWNKLAAGKGVKLAEMLREYQGTVDTVNQCWAADSCTNTWEDELRYNIKLYGARANIEAFLTYAYSDAKVPAEGSRWVSDHGVAGVTEYNEDKTKWRFRYTDEAFSGWASVNSPIPAGSTWKEVAAETQTLVDTSPSIADTLPCEEFGFVDPRPQLFGEFWGDSSPTHSEGVVTETLEEDDAIDECCYYTQVDSEGVAAPNATTEIQNVEPTKEEIVDGIKLKLKKQYLQLKLDELGGASYKCLFCGKPSEVDPSDQVRPADQCHEEDHKSEVSENMLSPEGFIQQLTKNFNTNACVEVPKSNVPGDGIQQHLKELLDGTAQPVLPTHKITYDGTSTTQPEDQLWIVTINGNDQWRYTPPLAELLVTLNTENIEWTQSYIANLASKINWKGMGYKEALSTLERLGHKYTNRNQRGE